MKIAIDLRSLSSGSISGVENYIVNVLNNLLRLDRTNEYILFYNAWNQHHKPEFHYINARLAVTSIPNKILNAGLKFGVVNFEKIIGPIDYLFLPNLNQYSITPDTKLALTVHDLSPIVTPEFYNIKRRLWHTFLNYKKAFERAQVIFAVSEYTKMDIIKHFSISEHKIKVVYPGVDSDIYKPTIEDTKLRDVRNRYSLPGDYILFLNTIEPRKNLTGLLQAFEQLKHPIPLVIIGRKGWKYKKVLDQIKKSNKSKNIHYLGYVENESDKAAILRLARVLVYPSFYEGFGFQPLEAMATGVPVIASSVTAIPEVMGNGGLLVNPYQINELTSALESIVMNASLRKQLITNGLMRARKFTWEETAKNILQGLH